MKFTRNTFNGTPTSSEDFAKMFDVDDLADLRQSDCIFCPGVVPCEGGVPNDGALKVDAKDGSGWQLYGPSWKGDAFHCSERAVGECFKFVNSNTGQEAVYYVNDSGKMVYDDSSKTGSTFNYSTGNIFTKHNPWDMKLYDKYTVPYSEQNNGAKLPIAVPDRRSDFNNVVVPSPEE